MEGLLLGSFMAFLASSFWALGAILYRKAMIKSSNSMLMNGLRAPGNVVLLSLILLFLGKHDEFYSTVLNLESMVMIFLATFIAIIVGDSIYLLSLNRVGVSVAYPIAYSYPVYVSLLAASILGEELTLKLMLGLMLSVSGVWAFSSHEREVKNGGKTFGILLAFLTSILWAIAIVIFRISVFTADPIVVDLLKNTFLLAVYTPLLLSKIKEIRGMDRKTIFHISLGGMISVGLGDWFLYISLSEIGATRAALMTTFTPVTSIILAHFILKEKITRRQILGTVFIMLGIIFANVL
ncbi:MAG: DMT family transporter [Candidatus Asgardarchaeia archaeon]